MNPMRVLVVDDEALARSRLRTLLSDCETPATEVVAEAAHGAEALAELQNEPVDLVLLDVHMPGIDGIALARTLADMPEPPAMVFVTAHPSHAVTAFELDAVDYLTKPVRIERLRQALQKAERYLKDRRGPEDDESAQASLLIQDRDHAEKVPLSEVLYFKSELKYVTVRTRKRSLVLDGTLAELEERYPGRFLRVHRNALVARSAIRTLERFLDDDDLEGWQLRLAGIDEPVIVSRRQLTAVRDVLKGLA
jgi:two-component system response regulator AlgR